MRPPICTLCDAPADPPGGLVCFATNPRSEDWHRRANAEPGFAGHPPNEEWFCADHHPAAAALSHLTLPAAMRQLRS